MPNRTTAGQSARSYAERMPELPRVRAPELRGRGWLNTAGRGLRIADLRGRFVLLDFWTSCCVNCLHVLDELRPLERRWTGELLVVGVHSPKFEHEADPAAVRAAVERYEVDHPVLDDPTLATWDAYAARAWPTLVLVDPAGYVVGQYAGEGHVPAIDLLLDRLVAEHDAAGTLRREDPTAIVEPAAGAGVLRFPAGLIELPGGNLLVADAGHHALTELGADGETLLRRIGSGERGLVDGDPTRARFSEPTGLCAVPPELRPWLGYDVVVADTGNHVLRGVRLTDGSVRTVAGTGEPYRVGAPDNVVPEFADRDAGGEHDGRDYSGPPCGVRLSSPWDVTWSQDRAGFVVAMAGTHTLWEFDDEEGSLRRLAGTLHEGLSDGPADESWFAQPSSAATGPDGTIWIADAETSALRRLDPVTRVTSTAIGQGLFEFGHVDGPADRALLQHPLGVVALADGSVVLADTYNGAIRRFVPDPTGGPGQVDTLASGLAEPSGLVVRDDPDRSGRLEVVVAESAAHRLTRVPLHGDLHGELHGDRLEALTGRSRRPVTELPVGPVRLEVPFEPAPGQQLDERYGPATWLTVSASPPELLVAGAGDGTALVRDLVFAVAVGTGVLHVSARVAACDDDPDRPHPACHLSQQDWGITIRLDTATDVAVDTATDARRVLRIPLRG